MEIGFIMAGFFILVTLIFIAVAIFFPEWVGIQGKVARQIEAEQMAEDSANAKNKEN